MSRTASIIAALSGSDARGELVAKNVFIGRVFFAERELAELGLETDD